MTALTFGWSKSEGVFDSALIHFVVFVVLLSCSKKANNADRKKSKEYIFVHI